MVLPGDQDVSSSCGSCSWAPGGSSADALCRVTSSGVHSARNSVLHLESRQWVLMLQVHLLVTGGYICHHQDGSFPSRNALILFLLHDIYGWIFEVVFSYIYTSDWFYFQSCHSAQETYEKVPVSCFMCVETSLVCSLKPGDVAAVLSKHE